jgi:hypothetical protein
VAFHVQGVKKGHRNPEKSSMNQTAAYHVPRINDETEVSKVAFSYVHGILRGRAHILVKKKEQKLFQSVIIGKA